MPAITFLHAFLNRSILRRADERAGFRSLRTFIAGLLFALLPVLSARAATTFVVTTTADGNHGACTVSLCTLRDAIIAANASAGQDTITLPAGTYTLTIAGANENAAATGDLDITESIIINGAGAATTIVDGGALDRVFDVIGASTLAVFNDITIRNGLTTGQGGGINSAGSSSLNIHNCVITGNSAGGQGGGVFTVSMVMTNTIVSNNHSTGDQGGGLFLINNSFGITNSTITGNTSLDDGGGIYVNGSINSNNPALLSILNSTVSNNTGPDGGGIFILSFASVVIDSSTFSGNTATSAGGAAINNDGAILTVINSTISGNTISAGSQGGGGIFNNGAAAVAGITSTTISSNSSPSATGGGILNNGGTVTLKNTIVANNTGGNCVGTVGNGGTNLQFPGTTCGGSITSADPLLQPLANNGGPTLTQSLGAGSPAINAGDSCPPPPSDQRDVSRPQGSACEIGAFECQTGECGGVGPTATPTPTNTPAGVATSTPTNTPTNTPTAVAATPTRTQTQIAGVVVPTLSSPILALLGLALAGTALLLLKR